MMTVYADIKKACSQHI